MLHTLSRTISDSSSSGRQNSPFRIAIAGCGPRGLYCLQALAAQLIESKPSTPVEIDVFEPAAYPGAGVVYAPTQPSYLRMNFAAKYINAWPARLSSSHSTSSTSTGQHLNLSNWLRIRGHSQYDQHSFVPRALVGEYLHDCFQQAIKDLSQLATIQIHRMPVSHVTRCQQSWEVATEQFSIPADEVAITIGHGGWRPSESQRHANKTRTLPVFPVERHLTLQHVPPGQTVAIRGFGLTAIDGMLALTEGRGGTFHSTDRGMIYHPSGTEPACIFPYSRSGRPMLAKPDEQRFPQPELLEPIWAEGRAAIANLAEPITREALEQVVWSTVVSSAGSALAKLHPDMTQDEGITEVDHWIHNWMENETTPQSVYAQLQRSVKVATGRIPPDAAWAMGAAWRKIYPAIVDSVSHGGLTESAWPRFRPLATEMERIAFGPPAENVARLLALIDAGIVDLTHIADCDHANKLAADIEINAVLPSPTDCSGIPLLQKLWRGEVLESMPGTKGITVNQAGRPMRRGKPVSGLAVFGRPTEGCVLGNDTLSRSLHRHPEHWAAEVAGRLSPAAK